MNDYTKFHNLSFLLCFQGFRTVFESLPLVLIEDAALGKPYAPGGYLPCKFLYMLIISHCFKFIKPEIHKYFTKFILTEKSCTTQ